MLWKDLDSINDEPNYLLGRCLLCSTSGFGKQITLAKVECTAQGKHTGRSSEIVSYANIEV
jgi:hypothetical protein